MFSRNEIGEAWSTPIGPPRQPWWMLEEFKPDGGMWSLPRASMREQHARDASDLMADPERFREAMRRVLREWPNSVSAAVASPGLNLRAWMGQAGCWLGVGSPNDATRDGWRLLDGGEQFGANSVADDVIGEYRVSIRQASPQASLWGDDYA